MDEFHHYLFSGGMPDVVSSLLQTYNIQEVRARQRDIADLYRLDISKYAGNRARTVRRIFDLIPAELNTQSKRFAFGHIEGMSRFNRYDNDFTWLVDAGIVIPVCNVDEPRYPLEVKSGKSYRRHSALSKALEIENYGIERAVVLHEGNVELCGKVAYLPMYMTMVLD